MSGNAHERMIELLDEAGQTYFKAMQTGLQVQQDVANWWSDQMASAPTADLDLQVVITDAVNQWKSNAEKSLAMMEQSANQSVDLLNKAFAVGQADSIEAAQQKLNELWEQSLKTMQDNVQATLTANEQFAQAWMDLSKKQAAQQAE